MAQQACLSLQDSFVDRVYNNSHCNSTAAAAATSKTTATKAISRGQTEMTNTFIDTLKQVNKNMLSSKSQTNSKNMASSVALEATLDQHSKAHLHT